MSILLRCQMAKKRSVRRGGDVPLFDEVEQEPRHVAVSGRPCIEGSDGPSIEDSLIECARRGDPDRGRDLVDLFPSVEMGR